ncbi:hypothetical protein PI126_g16695 [Phytophthora idaei]|nr:hypothetical protein PI126_g16695 [Phytophthora idaei]
MEEGSPACDPVVAYNDLMLQIDNEIVTVYRFVADICAAKFPELHSLTRDLPTLLSSSAVFRAPAAHKPTGMELFDDNDDDMRASAATLSLHDVNASDSFSKTELPSLTVSLEVLQPPLQCTKCHSCSFARHLNRHVA